MKLQWAAEQALKTLETEFDVDLLIDLGVMDSVLQSNREERRKRAVEKAINLLKSALQPSESVFAEAEKNSVDKDQLES